MAWAVPQLVARVQISHSTRKTGEPVTELVNRVQIGHKLDTSAGFLFRPVTRDAREIRLRQNYTENPLCFHNYVDGASRGVLTELGLGGDGGGGGDGGWRGSRGKRLVVGTSSAEGSWR